MARVLDRLMVKYLMLALTAMYDLHKSLQLIRSKTLNPPVKLIPDAK